MIKQYKAKIDTQYRDAKGKIRSVPAGTIVDQKNGEPKLSRHFELISGEPQPAPPLAPPPPPPVDEGGVATAPPPPPVSEETPKHPGGRPKKTGAAH